jgi:hypothetical protein
VVTFVETKLFTKLVQEYLSDDEYAALQQWLVANPDAGDVIPGSGGVRKLRWGATVGEHSLEGVEEDQGGDRCRGLSGTSVRKFSKVFYSSNEASMAA